MTCARVCGFRPTARDVVKQLTEENVSSPLDFNWIAQLRYYWEQDTVQVGVIAENVR